MRVIKVTLLFITAFFMTTSLNAEEYTRSKGEIMFNVPYSLNYGYLLRKNDTQLYAPYIGVGMTTTKFSISYSAQIGMAVFHKNYSWRLEYVYNIVPDVSFFWNYDLTENYIRNISTYDFNGFRIMSTTKFGHLLTAKHSPNDDILEQNAFTTIGIHQIFSFDSQLYHDDFAIFTGMLNIGFTALPYQKQASIDFQTIFPLTFDFQHSRLGFVGTLFYSRYLTSSQELIIGEKYYGYDAAVDLVTTDPTGLINKFYEFTGMIEFAYRIYFSTLPIPFDRFYIAFGANTGLGHVGKEWDLLYMGTIAFGYELYDTIPFEFKFGLDQDRNFFLNLSIVSPIAHRFDSNID